MCKAFPTVCMLLTVGSLQPAYGLWTGVDGGAPTGTYVRSMADAGGETVILTGADLSLEQVVRIARHGAKVSLSPAARQRSADAYGLLLEAAAEGVSVYWFNRGFGDQRETQIFSGNPTTPENAALIMRRQREMFLRGGTGSYGPEIDHEDVVRAMMAIRANTMSYEAASPGLTQLLLDMLNADVTPVIHREGTLGEGDLATTGDLGRAMLGVGDAYFHGKRMSAAAALEKAGLKPLIPAGADDAALMSTNAYFVANACLLTVDAQGLLDWADLATAMALLGMNSNVSPLSSAVGDIHPFAWLNWDAARVLNLLRGSYLLEDDPKRILQDPESLRASTQRVGSAWQAWALLRQDVLLAMNSSDHNPAVRPGLKPGASWELETPQLMKFYVKGGPLSHGQGGYILSSASWDPYPLCNDVEGFSLALANMNIVLVQRMERFHSVFFTGIRPSDVLSRSELEALSVAGDYRPVDLWMQISGLMNPVSPQGQPIVSGVEDLEAASRLKVERAREMLDTTAHLMAQDFIVSSNWVEVRRAENRTRRFGDGPTAALQAVRQALGQERGSGGREQEELVYGLMTSEPGPGLAKELQAPPTGFGGFEVSR